MTKWVEVSGCPSASESFCKQFSFFASRLTILNRSIFKLAGTVMDISPHNRSGHIFTQGALGDSASQNFKLLSSH